MKKIILFLLVMVSFSCTKNPENQAKENVEKYMKAKLDDPKSYESVSFGKIDSVFSPFSESKEGIELSLKEDKLSEREAELSARIDVTESISELEKIMKESKEITQKRFDLVDTILDKSLKYKGTFCGYEITHTFRAKNKMGALVLDSCTVDLDTKMNVKLVR